VLAVRVAGLERSQLLTVGSSPWQFFHLLPEPHGQGSLRPRPLPVAPEHSIGERSSGLAQGERRNTAKIADSGPATSWTDLKSPAPKDAAHAVTDSLYFRHAARLQRFLGRELIADPTGDRRVR
jgi:hypothetical protein